jgi:hypothetical protein
VFFLKEKDLSFDEAQLKCEKKDAVIPSLKSKMELNILVKDLAVFGSI